MALKSFLSKLSQGFNGINSLSTLHLQYWFINLKTLYCCPLLPVGTDSIISFISPDENSDISIPLASSLCNIEELYK